MKIHDSIVRVLNFLHSKGFAIEVAWRYSSDSWNYDGKTIALNGLASLQRLFTTESSR